MLPLSVRFSSEPPSVPPSEPPHFRYRPTPELLADVPGVLWQNADDELSCVLPLLFRDRHERLFIGRDDVDAVDVIDASTPADERRCAIRLPLVTVVLLATPQAIGDSEPNDDGESSGPSVVRLRRDRLAGWLTAVGVARIGDRDTRNECWLELRCLRSCGDWKLRCSEAKI